MTVGTDLQDALVALRERRAALLAERRAVEARLKMLQKSAKLCLDAADRIADAQATCDETELWRAVRRSGA